VPAAAEAVAAPGDRAPGRSRLQLYDGGWHTVQQITDKPYWAAVTLASASANGNGLM
jgi:hypothetical protein